MNCINKHKADCCGCTACAKICAYGAINMQTDVLGFKYPIVDSKRCVDCGLCVKVCQFKNNYESFDVDTPVIYAFRNKDEEQVMHSQSGAAFWTIAQQFIKEGGVVYGCGFDNDFNVIHKRAVVLEELEDMRGSKYVQSDLLNTFNDAKEDLKKGLKVLYTGTSCQIANIKSFVGNHLRENLYTLDLVCHGVPSPRIYKDYLETIRKKNKKVLTKFDFRDKTKGWKMSIQSFSFGEKIHYSTDYSRYFYSNLLLRECCYECPYTNFNRISDISMADFWGWNKISDKFDDNKGVSLLLVNSCKGRELLNSVENISYIIKIEDREVCMQRNLERPTFRNHLRSKFEEDYEKNGYDYVAKKYLGKGIKDTVVRNFKSLIKKLFRLK